MTEVRIFDKSPAEIMDIVRELRAQGLVQGRDFDFAYKPEQYDNDGWTSIHKRYTVFMFHTEKYATLFAIKYSK